MSLYEAIASLSDGFNGVLGISVKNLETGEHASFNGDRLFPTASVFKVPVIVEFYRQAEAGRLNLDDVVTLREEDKVPGSGVLKELSAGLNVTLSDLLSLMMIVSDNTATDLILRKVSMENVNRMLRGLALEKTAVSRYCREILFDLVGVQQPLEELTISLWDRVSENSEHKGSWSLGVIDNDVTTPDEMARLLELVALGEAAGRDSCDAILTVMGKCQTGQYRIPKYLPGSMVKMQRKTGSLPGIRNDVGVITLKKPWQRYVLSCFTMDAENIYEAEEVIARVSEAVFQYFSSA